MFFRFSINFLGIFVMFLCLGRVFHELHRTGSTLLRINQKWRINTPKVWGFVSSQRQIKPPTDFLISKKRPNLQNSEIYLQNKFKTPKKVPKMLGRAVGVSRVINSVLILNLCGCFVFLVQLPILCMHNCCKSQNFISSVIFLVGRCCRLGMQKNLN